VPREDDLVVVKISPTMSPSILFLAAPLDCGRLLKLETPFGAPLALLPDPLISLSLSNLSLLYLTAGQI